MKRERAKELLPVIQAFADGEEIECRNIRQRDRQDWHSINDPGWCKSNEYRIKPEPREFWIDLTEREFIESGKGSKYWGEENDVIKVREVLSE